jgi:hypothetical protein
MPLKAVTTVAFPHAEHLPRYLQKTALANAQPAGDVLNVASRRPVQGLGNTIVAIAQATLFVQPALDLAPQRVSASTPLALFRETRRNGTLTAKVRFRTACEVPRSVTKKV